MAEYERAQAVDADADALFDYLSEVGNLPKYFSRMVSAAPAGGDAVRVRARLDGGQEVDGEAWFRVDPSSRRIDWGSEGPKDYRGWLEVRDRGDSAEVEVHISTAEVVDDRVDEGINETLREVRRLVEDAGAGQT